MGESEDQAGMGEKPIEVELAELAPDPREARGESAFFGAAALGVSLMAAAVAFVLVPCIMKTVELATMSQPGLVWILSGRPGVPSCELAVRWRTEAESGETTLSEGNARVELLQQVFHRFSPRSGLWNDGVAPADATEYLELRCGSACCHLALSPGNPLPAELLEVLRRLR